MPKQPTDEHGRPTALWTTLEDAKRNRAAHYDCGEECSECNVRGFTGLLARKRYTANGRCVHCALMEAIELQSLATYVAAIDLLPDGTLEYILHHQETGTGRPVSQEYVDRLEAALALAGDGPTPTTRQGALEIRSPVYVRDTPCRSHGHLGVRTVRSECYYCEQDRNTPTPRQRAIQAGESTYTPTDPCLNCGEHAPRRVDNGQCTGCKAASSGVLTPRQQAIRAGCSWYVPNDPCPNCGRRAEKRVDNGQCAGCKSASRKQSPRQGAIRAGRKWYTPTQPCTRCGQIAEKRVDNGQCRGCSDTAPSATDGRGTPDSVMMREAPDMVVDRETARATGLKVYRTGKLCRRGHCGFRYVSTGQCLDCRGV